ncbi:DUF4880 domain-containing protein [Porphyrobacter algicida]|uniref:DUF4880 domain-containing protein n=1 Tax=Qipengyuania algicida TaxID=1836209 RepID=A0A845AID5_9SPHN|nr:FecR domain-containing protein [Qipengyuania algicida]MXP30020.1 DUF4880 domain-containing protein [Qipengyuania algicida]
MKEFSRHIVDEAVRWHLASEGDDMDWNGFTDWLEANPRHREAYDQVAMADALATVYDRELATVEDDPSREHKVSWRKRVWPIWAGTAIAASLLGLVLVPQLHSPTPTIYSTTTIPREIALEDGSHITLAPDSRLVVSGRGDHVMELIGTGYFAIAHVNGRRLTIKAGALQISDIGTDFDVQVNGQSTRVAVAQGALTVTSDNLAEPIKLSAGKQFGFDLESRRAIETKVVPATVGEWRTGRLSYDDTPLPVVVSDLARFGQLRINVSPALAQRRFSGTLSIQDGKSAVKDLARIMAIRIVARGNVYHLEP